MSGAFVRVAFVWMLIFLIIQPLLSHIDYLLYVVVKSNANYAAEKAAPDGMLTPSVREQVLANLQAVGIDPSQVVIVSNASSPLKRGEELEIQIEAPRLPMFVYQFTGQELPTTYFAKAYTTSEYIP
ncbi:hypothetical protein ACFOQM_04090 [Paenibacillus sp. GCM10012307]|uniref:Uncharacterized protein n=1 Tax=Paenibacillus roseus TaxID=2798579 RepID=A0A934J534_9BACL|nr:hypothetical protein [Paenibacillus roseus]MBJ6360493.1 hypothetical protein [Paenibacillus roseus]